MHNRFHYLSLLLTVPLVICYIGQHTGQAAETYATVDALERQLELSRHDDLISQKEKSSSTLNEFTTDGCSGGLSVGWEYLASRVKKFEEVHGGEPPWESCCVIHDRAYHTGGDRNIEAKTSFDLRKSADQDLRNCVQESAAGRTRELGEEYGIPAEEVERLYSLIGSLMYRAVRIGGIPCTGLPWRWGYGWTQCD